MEQPILSPVYPTAESVTEFSRDQMPIIGVMEWPAPPAAFRALQNVEECADAIELREEITALWSQRGDFRNFLRMAMRQWNLKVEPRVLGGFYCPEEGGIVVCLHCPSWIR
jgi:hypothetical protein